MKLWDKYGPKGPQSFSFISFKQMKKLTWHAGIFPPYQGQDDLHRVWEADELPGGLHLQIWQEQIVLYLL